MSQTMIKRSASRADSKVVLNPSIKVFGRFEINPTVSIESSEDECWVKHSIS